VINFVPMFYPDRHLLALSLNLTLSLGWFLYMFGPANIPLWITTGTLLFLVCCSSVTLQYEQHNNDPPHPMSIVPPPKSYAMDYTAQHQTQPQQYNNDYAPVPQAPPSDMQPVLIPTAGPADALLPPTAASAPPLTQAGFYNRGFHAGRFDGENRGFNAGRFDGTGKKKYRVA
jgi:hypothetical protein